MTGLAKTMYKLLRLKNRYRFYIRNAFGFSITDMMIAVAIISIIAAVATPNIQGIMQGYKIKMAISDLVSYVNIAKTRAAKTNLQWHIDLDPSGFDGYQIYYNNTGGNKIVVASVNFDACNDKGKYDKCYGGVEYKSSDSSSICAEKEFVFFPSGLTNICSVTLTHKQSDNYYRVGLLAASGIIRTQKWNGSDWE
jgi:Tfp pilus assembly protein FimT